MPYSLNPLCLKFISIERVFRAFGVRFFEVLLYAIRTIISRIGPFNVNEVDVLPFQDFCDLRQLV